MARRASRSRSRSPPIDRYTVDFILKPAVRIVPAESGLQDRAGGSAAASSGTIQSARDRTHFVSYAVDDRAGAARLPRLLRGAAAKQRHRPEDRARRHHARPRASESTRPISSSTTWRPTWCTSSRKKACALAKSPGVDYQYVGFNLRDPVLQDVRVRHAIGHAIDRQAIVDYLRRGLATVADSMLPPTNWALRAGCARARLRSRTGESAARRGRLSRSRRRRSAAALLARLSRRRRVEFHRLQAAVIQQNLRAGRHRGRRTVVRICHAVCRHPEGEFSDVLAAMGRRRAGRSRHSAAGLPLAAGTARRLQSRPLQRPGSRSADRRSVAGDRLRDPAASSTERCSS